MTQMQDRIASRVGNHEEVIKRQIDEAATAASRAQEQQGEHRRNLQTIVDACKLEFGSNQTRLLNLEGQLAPLLGAVGGGAMGMGRGGGRPGKDLMGLERRRKAQRNVGRRRNHITRLVRSHERFLR